MTYDVAIVGGGLAGLTSAAYLAQAGCKVVLCEKQDKTGGLVNSFTYRGFTLDGGIRAIENSGIVFPMLRQLGIEMPFYPNPVSLVVEGERLLLEKEDFLGRYQAFLSALFPQDLPAVQKLTREVARSMKHMDILYGFDNPLFVDWKEDQAYALSLIPWMCKYLFIIGKVDGLSQPIDDYLRTFIDNPALVDMFAQHFFKKTPAFFALSYFSLYLDYHYPAGGTGALADKLADKVRAAGGEIRLGWAVQSLHPEKRTLTSTRGESLGYKKLIWAADAKQLYQKVDYAQLRDPALKTRLVAHRDFLQPKTGSDSIYTVYLLLNRPAEDLAPVMSPHVFYTPKKQGLSHKSLRDKQKFAFENQKIIGTQQDVLNWTELYLQLNTFEVSCPALRDKTLAPPGQSALIVSCLFDCWILREIERQGFYQKFKEFCQQTITAILYSGFLPGSARDVQEVFSSTPLTIQRLTENTDGSVTGWSFENAQVPAVTKMSQVAKTIQTQIPNVYQAGQWTFAPSGLPIAVLTGKLAADKAKKELDK